MKAKPDTNLQVDERARTARPSIGNPQNKPVVYRHALNHETRLLWLTNSAKALKRRIKEARKVAQ